MKTKRLFTQSIILTILITVLIINSDNVFSQPGWIIRSTSTNINSVFFINSSNGWMVGDSGFAYATYDGGVNWSGLNSNTTSKLNSVFFTNELTGWAAGNNGTIIRTIDGGNNWIVAATGVSWNINSIHFPTSDTGYAIGVKNLISTDAGVSWSENALTLSANSGYFISANTGFYVNGSNIFKTTTGGSAWFTTIFTGSFNSLFFFNSTTGWASGSGIRYTTNAGSNWTVQTTGAGFSTLYGIHFSDASTGWSVGSIGMISGNSEIRRTTNSGLNWTGQSSGTTNILRSVSAVNSINGVITGDAGTVLMTTNSGSNWNNVLSVYAPPSNLFYNLNTVFFADENTGWSGGQLGVVNKTTDGGSSWNSYSSSSFSQINSMTFLDKDTGWISGAGGMVQMTVNGGINWISQALGVSETVNDIDIHKFTLTGFSGLHRIGWSVLNGGRIFKTTNGGSNWAEQISSTAADLYSVTGFSENVAIACGDSGKIIKTTNGGVSWIPIVTGAVGGVLRSLAFADNNYGICAGDSATVLYTTNQGNTWIKDITGPRSLTLKNLYSVSARLPAMASYTAVGDEGVILKTEDEGASWTLLSSGVKTRLTGISTPTDVAGYVSGTRGTFLKTIDGGALPVELTGFYSAVDKNNVTLTWITSGEINNRGFEIQRNKDHNIWAAAGFVDGAGNTQNQSQYSFTDKNLSTGKYNYRLKQIDFNGNFKYYDLYSDVYVGNPQKFTLGQNYPNPFNPVTSIDFEIPYRSHINIKVYDILGKEVKSLINDNMDEGIYKIEFNGIDMSSGVYFYSLETQDVKIVKKFILMK